MKKFNELGISEDILSAIEEIGHTNATLVQEKAIPALKEGDDIIILSQTGSGKTLAFAVPALESVDTAVTGPQVLVICPTRELATQVSDEFKRLSKNLRGVKVFAVFGGQPIYKQIQGLKARPNVIIGTPGRIIDHMERRTLKLETVKMLVLDEADEMLKMGFREDIEEISTKLAGKRQGVLASATMSKEIKILTQKFLENPVIIDAGDANSPAKTIHQEYIAVSPKGKKQLLVNMLKGLDGTALVFCNTKKMTTAIFEFLNEQNIPAKEIHGDMRQSERTRAMNAFKAGVAKILVATDVAARGIDVNNITYVINYDYPEMEEYYIHRIGRTGRAGNKGVAYTFITTSNQMANLTALSSRLGFKITNSSLSSDIKFDKSASTVTNNKRSRFNSRGGQSNKNKKPYKKSDNSQKKSSYFDNKENFAKPDSYFDKKDYSDKKTYGKRDNSDRKPYSKKENNNYKKSYSNKDDNDMSKPNNKKSGFSKSKGFNKGTQKNPFKQSGKTNFGSKGRVNKPKNY
jgi:ATP-dependent RNA helicase DeaD